MLAPLLLSLILGVAGSADAKETSSPGTSAKASRATPAATARPRSKARPTSSAKQARPSAKRATGKASPPAETAPAAVEAPASSEQSEAKPDAAGVKTFTFKAQEIEGRLKAPQILYFLRRVRAEFDAQDLGHRSFLLELSDTRRQQALR